jgi:hypothetical protein
MEINRRIFHLFAALAATLLADWVHGVPAGGSGAFAVIDDLGNLVIDDLGNQVVQS